MSKPLIAFSPRYQQTELSEIYYDNTSYFEYVERNGGIGCIVQVKDEKDALQIANTFDGLVITGGEDCNPALYHQENTNSSCISPEIETADILLYQAFQKVGKPIFGICRGMQIINVIEHGTLIQDIPTQRKDSMQHNQRELNLTINDLAHSVFVKENSTLSKFMKPHHMVNSFHHQAIDELATSFKAVAISEDDIVEAMEKENVICVQWHPERMNNDSSQQELMRYFLSKCKCD